MSTTGKVLTFGADYYPEQWNKQLWESDADRMKDMGITQVRLMEFAWTIIEPEEGVYDFSLFDEVIDLFASREIKTILGTPTATFPVWLYQKDPEIMQVYLDGTRKEFGIRRHACYNSQTYFDACMNITKIIAEHYGNNPNIIGWQVDNEIGHESSDVCICDNCKKAFSEWLHKKYKTIDNLNKTWGTVFWGTTYSDFSQVPLHSKQMQSIQNPGLILDYYRFCSDSAVKFIHSQVDILRNIVNNKQWITHNIYNPTLSNAIDMEEIFKPMDFAGYNNYPVWGDMDEPLPYFFTSCVLSYIRGMKDREKFTIFEQICGFQGHTCLGYLPPVEQVVQWTNQAIAHGAERIIYFRWRTAKFGQEQLCYGLLDPDNEDTERKNALMHNINENYTDLNTIASSTMITSACVVYDKDNARVLKDQFLSKGIYNTPTGYMQVGYEMEIARHYAPYVLFNITSDVKTPESIDLSRYSIISLPMYQLVDPSFVTELEKWVRDGGTLILGWRTGTREPDNQAVTAILPGQFTEMAGVTVRRFESLNETSVKIKIGMIPVRGEVWADLVEPVSAKVIARYTDSKKHYKGMAAITENQFGKGRVFYLGTSPNPAGIFFLYRKIFKHAGLKPRFHANGVEVLYMKDMNGDNFRVAMNHTGKSKRVGLTRLKPYQMKIIR